jgi:hypothetical protein
MPCFAKLDDRPTSKALALMSFDRACLRGETDSKSSAAIFTMIYG